MFSLRSKSQPARIASAATLLLAICVLLTAIPGAALAAPEGGEEEAPTAPQLAFEPANYDFGLVQLDGNVNQATMQLRNVGPSPAQVYSFEISGGNGAFSTGPSDCIRTLGPGETCSIQVYFGPYDAVPFAAQLRVNAEAGTVVTAALAGEGGRAAFTPAVDPTNFGSVPVGSAGVTRTIDVTNTGNMPGSLFIAVIAGGAIGSFHIVDENCTGVMMTPDATCNVEVSFQPLSTGAKTARLALFGDSDGGAQINLTGVGVAPESSASKPPASPQASAASASAQPRKHRTRGGRLRRGKKIGLAFARRAIR
jgi:hypothetical protein